MHIGFIAFHLLNSFKAIHRMVSCTCWIVIAESNRNQSGFSHAKITLTLLWLVKKEFMIKLLKACYIYVIVYYRLLNWC